MGNEKTRSFLGTDASLALLQLAVPQLAALQLASLSYAGLFNKNRAEKKSQTGATWTLSPDWR